MNKILLSTTAILIFLGCTHTINPLAPEHLAGEYELVTYTDKRINVVYESGVPTENGTGQLTSFEGSLILTRTEFQILRVITFHTSSNTQSVNEHVSGNYFINDQVFIIKEEISGRSDFIPISIRNDLLILEDADFKFVYKRS